ncbi:hypothetical protein [Streptosporangium sp. NPDC006007]|uniref:hypothetical protein n=1 Tax=Streptosporangium sp. NPDC006007 TaxID=3154575 RepID=UPI00339DC829
MNLDQFAQTLLGTIRRMDGVVSAELIDGQEPPLIGIAPDAGDAFFVEIQPS